MTVRFIEFVRRQAQHIALCLGRIPHPQTGKPQVNLDVAQMLIEQLAAVAFKTRGNLSPDEESLLKNTLSSLQNGLLEARAAARVSTPPAAGKSSV